MDLSGLTVSSSTGIVYLRLYDSNGTEVKASTGSSTRDTITYSVNADETYTVRVDPRGDITSII
ncbi:hypothetical protein [Thiorhodovibrio winogradskyi]|uniref:hypothetical protein n=1 Tax=Thiorhodovibrio winogradskyi TaxID=77007 RepID=UPI0038B66A02